MSDPEQCEKTRPSPLIRTRMLVWKNLLNYTRNRSSTLIQLGCPILICIYLIVLQQFSELYIAQDRDPDPGSIVAAIPRCWGPACVTLGIIITGEKTEWAEYAIGHIAKATRLELNKDILVYNSDSLTYMQSLSEHMNRTQVGLILCTSNFTLPENEYLSVLPCQLYNSTNYVYSIIYNYTAVEYRDFGRGDQALYYEPAIGTKLAIDNAILAYEAEKQGLEPPVLTAEYSQFPRTASRFLKGYGDISQYGPLYFSIPPMISFGMLVAEIVKEKEYKLRHGLLVMGVSNFEFWLSWLLTALGVVFLITNVQILCGYAFAVKIFLKTPYL